MGGIGLGVGLGIVGGMANAMTGGALMGGGPVFHQPVFVQPQPRCFRQPVFNGFGQRVGSQTVCQ